MAGAALLAACGDGDGDRVAALLREGAPIDRADAVRATWLFPPPAPRGAPRTPCRMTRARAEQDGLTPLHLASSNGDVHVAKLLLKQFARHDVKAQDGRRPLHLSSARGHIELTRLLLERGARIDVQTFVRNPPPLSHPPPVSEPYTHRRRAVGRLDASAPRVVQWPRGRGGDARRSRR